MGAAATGRKVAFGGITISRFRGSRIAEEWEMIDALSLLTQVGALPEPAAGWPYESLTAAPQALPGAPAAT